MCVSVAIRPLRQCDVRVVAELLGTVSEFVCSVELSDRWSHADLEKWITQDACLCQGAFHGKQIVGLCLGHLHVATGKLHVENLFVRENYRRRGVGRRLFEKAVTEAMKQCSGRLRIVALVQQRNTCGQAFFERVGLLRGEVMVWYQGNPEVPKGVGN